MCSTFQTALQKSCPYRNDGRSSVFSQAAELDDVSGAMVVPSSFALQSTEKVQLDESEMNQLLWRLHQGGRCLECLTSLLWVSYKQPAFMINVAQCWSVFCNCHIFEHCLKQVAKLDEELAAIVVSASLTCKELLPEESQGKHSLVPDRLLP